MCNVYLMVGLPGSGKTTWIQNNLPNLPVVSRDIIRCDLGYADNYDIKIRLTPSQEQKVTIVEDDIIREHCLKNEDFIIDNTNIGKYRTRRIAMLHELGAHIIGVVMITPFETCVERRAGQISRQDMELLKEKMLPLQPEEVDEYISVEYQK